MPRLPVPTDFAPGEQIHPVPLLLDHFFGDEIDMLRGDAPGGFLENLHDPAQIGVIVAHPPIPGHVGGLHLIVPAFLVDDFVGDHFFEYLGDQPFPVDGAIDIKKSRDGLRHVFLLLGCWFFLHYSPVSGSGSTEKKGEKAARKYITNIKYNLMVFAA